MTRDKLVCFSPTGEKLAHSGLDGILRIWNTVSGALEHEYQPAEHLTATTSCIRYSPHKPTKKGKAQKSEDANKNSLLAMGTLAGTILLYSPEKREVIATFEHGPPHAVLDVAWGSPTKLFSIGEDNTMIEWNISTGERISSAEVSGGSSLCSIDKNTLAVGHRSIEVVSLLKNANKVKVKRKFTGHMSLITQLLSIYAEEGSPRYFLSSSGDDRYFYAWDLQKEDSEPVGSFMVNDTILSVAAGKMKENTVLMAAVTTRGVLTLFRQHLNGNATRQAVKSIGKLKISTKSKSKKSAIPIVSAFFCNDTTSNIIIAYGNSSILKFEKLSVDEILAQNEIVREDPNKATVLETSLIKTVTPKVTKNATIISHYASLSQNENKRKFGDEDGAAALPMEERLNTLVLDTPTVKGEVPKADNLTQLLLQGLHSKDKRLLSGVFDRRDQDLINNTVRRLPVQAVVPLIEHLQTLVMGKGHKQFGYVTWIRAVLYYHMSHLSTIPNRMELMRPFFSASASKLSTLIQVTQLHARLDLMLNHVATRHQEEKQAEIEPDAMLVYRDDSSDDEDNMLDNVLGVSESEDQWDEMSDYGEINGHSDADSDMEADDNVSSVKRKLEEEKVVLDSDSEEEDNSEEEEDNSEEEEDDSELEIDESDNS
ncbi:WD repeat-containing protein 43-like isoform X2 [Penaeus japonicus]|nr:WD repeat-containing protein 43-like isoform X2 [Penaeus japonicus]